MRVMAQVAMVMALDKCIGCHTCSVTCKQAWTNRAGTEYVWFNNVETRPGRGLPPHAARTRRSGKGGWELTKQRSSLEPKSWRTAFQKLLHDFRYNPNQPDHPRLLRALDLSSTGTSPVRQGWARTTRPTAKPVSQIDRR